MSTSKAMAPPYFWVDNKWAAHHNAGMQIDFDPDKDAANIAKHGVSLAEAERLDWDTALIDVDDRFDYDELRMAGLGLIGADLFYVAFVEREDVTRIISLRPAEKWEFKSYVRYLTGR